MCYPAASFVTDICFDKILIKIGNYSGMLPAVYAYQRQQRPDRIEYRIV